MTGSDYDSFEDRQYYTSGSGPITDDDDVERYAKAVAREAKHRLQEYIKSDRIMLQAWHVILCDIAHECMTLYTDKDKQ